MRQHRRIRRLIGVVAGLAIIAAACGDDDDDEVVDEPEEDVDEEDIDVDLETDRLVIGRVAAETGPLAILGPPVIEGARFAIEDINEAGGVLGQDVEMIEADEAGDEAVARDNVVDLLGRGANVIVGAMSSGMSQSFIQLLFENQVPQCSPSNTSGEFSEQDNADYYFRMAFPDDAVVEVLANEMIADGHQAVAISARADDYGLFYQELLEEQLPELGLDVVYSNAFSEDVATYDAEVEEILGADPDAVMFVAFAEGGDLLRLMIERGFDPANLYGGDGVFTPELPDLVDETDANIIDGMKVVGMGGEDEFNERVGELTGGSAIYGAQAYDCVVVSALAAERAGQVDETLVEHAIEVTSADGTECQDFAECRDLLEEGEEISYNGAGGVVELNEVGDPTVGIYVIAEFIDGEMTPVSSVDQTL
jgi:ABC-type branched-subunit amino acid transport system substrate-binding protein